MSVDIITFRRLFTSGFWHPWDFTPNARSDVNLTGLTTPSQRSLDDEGTLSLPCTIYAAQCKKRSMQLIFAVVPSVLTRYIDFGLDILLAVL